MVTELWVNIGSGNGLLPSSNRNNVDISVSFSGIHLRAIFIASAQTTTNKFENYTFKIVALKSIPNGQWVTIHKSVKVISVEQRPSSYRSYRNNPPQVLSYN